MSVPEISADDYFKNRLEHYSNPCTEFMSRKFEWFRETDFSTTKVDVTHFEAMALGGLVCGLTGAGIGTAVAGPPGAVAGIGVGVPAGIVLGYLFVEGLKVRFSLDGYEEYIKTAEGREFAKKLTDLYKNDDALEHLRCKISYEPIINGVYVRGDKQNIYERKNIEAEIDRTGLDPYTRKKITKDDLIPAGDHISYEASVACVNFLKRKKEELEKTQPEMAKGFDIIINDYKKNFTIIHSNKMKKLVEDLQEGRITSTKYANECTKANQKYLIF